MTISSTLKILALAALAVLPACDMNQETWISPNRAQVERERYDTALPSAGVSQDFYKELARQYKAEGGGQMYLTFTYNPSGTAAEKQALAKAADAQKAMRLQGVSDIRTDVLAVNDPSQAGNILISYDKYVTRAPKDCTKMPGLEDNQIETGWDYKFGCSLEERFAAQLARPSDLLGNAAAPDTSSGRRAATMALPHEAGAANEPLEIDTIRDITE